MADIGASRRGEFYGRRTSLAWRAALALSVAGCAELLDLPSDPRLEAPTAQPAESEPARGEVEPSAPGAGPEPLVAGGSAGSDSDPDPVSMGGMPAENGDPGPVSPAGGTGAAPIESSTPDAGAPLVPPLFDAGAPEPELPAEPPSGCVLPESVGPNGRCFLVVEEVASWDDARLNCQRRGDDWDLAAIRSQAVNDFVGGLTDEEAWLGGSDADVEGTWRWVSDGDAFWSGDGTTGSAVDDAFEAWNSDEPNGRGNSDCSRTVPIIRTGDGLTWADLECFELRASLCEGPPL